VKVLSIDLDFISSPAINKYHTHQLANHTTGRQHPLIKWEELLQYAPDIVHSMSHEIDIDNYDFCLRTFIRALKNCKDVYFGYDHDAILFGLEGHNDIEIVNIDHHSDILSGYPGDEKEEMEELLRHDNVMEGNWGYYLQMHNRLKSFHWILNDTTEEHGDLQDGMQLLNNFSWSYRHAYDFGDYKFDQIFVCISPAYIPPTHWHMFGTFIRVYEELVGKVVDKDKLHRKYQYRKHYTGVTRTIF
tara:strand:- start:1122 stop:1856 length:735 start_codon:yes stop_codon:yes gene_type:complete